VSPSRSKAASGSFALWTCVKVVVAATLVFVLARIVIPDLVDAHDTTRLILAIACGVLAIAIVVAAAISIRRSYRRLRRTGANLPATNS
jgi:hypothetical protein